MSRRAGHSAGVTQTSLEPSSLYAGDTWTWRRALTDYPASAGWVLKYVLANAGHRLNITSTASGDEHAVSVPAATTAAVPAGSFTWQAFVEKGAERFTIGRGTLTVLAGLIDAGTAGADLRSEAQVALDAARLALKTYTETNGAVSEYEVNTGQGSRRVKYRSVDELRQLVAYWARQVEAERIKQQRRQGKSLAGRIVTRFGR